MGNKLPWEKWVWNDWIGDPLLSKCSPATRGIWKDLLGAMFKEDCAGELRGTAEELSRLARCQPVEMTSALTELKITQTADVTFRNGVWVVINRRKKREAEKLGVTAARVARHRARGGGDPDGWTSIRAYVLRRDKNTCAYCGKPALTVDHILARVKGGTNDLFNLVGSCMACQLKKQDRSMEEAGMSFHSSFDNSVLNGHGGPNGHGGHDVSGDCNADGETSNRSVNTTDYQLKLSDVTPLLRRRLKKPEVRTTTKLSREADGSHRDPSDSRESERGDGKPTGKRAKLSAVQWGCAKRFEEALGPQWVNDAGKWIGRVRAECSKAERVVAEVENAAKEGRIETTPAQYAEQIWKEFK